MAVRQPVGRLPATALDSCSTIALDAVVDGPALLPPPVLLMLSLLLLLLLLLPKRLLKLSIAAPTQSPDEEELDVATTIRTTFAITFLNRTAHCTRGETIQVPTPPKGSVLCTGLAP